MADELVTKRITTYGAINYPTEDFANDDVLFVDGSSQGTRKVNVKAILNSLNGGIDKAIKSSNVSVTASNYSSIITNVNDQPINSIYAYAAGLQSNITNLPSNAALSIIHYTYKVATTMGVGQVMIATERSGDNATMYFRTTGGSPVAWSSWQKLANNADVENEINSLKADLSESIGDLKSALINSEGQILSNWYDKSKNTSGILSASGEQSATTTTTWVVTDYLPVESGAKYQYKGTNYGNYNTSTCACFYDSSKNFISGGYFVPAHGGGDFETPSTCSFVRFTLRVDGTNDTETFAVSKRIIFEDSGIIKDLSESIGMFDVDFVPGLATTSGTIDTDNTLYYSSTAKIVSVPYKTLITIEQGYNALLRLFNQDGTYSKTIIWFSGAHEVDENQKLMITLRTDPIDYTVRPATNEWRSKVSYNKYGMRITDLEGLTSDLCLEEGVIDANFVSGIATTEGTIDPVAAMYYNSTEKIVSIPFDAVLSVDSGYQFLLRLFDASGKCTGTVGWFTDSYLMPANQKFMAVVNKNPSDTSVVTIRNEYRRKLHYGRKNKQWEGKKWYAFGTSISDTTFSMPYDLPGVTGKYPPYLVALSGLEHHNYALGGSRITNEATSDRDTILRRILSTDLSDADLITIDGFVNDFGACEIGDLESLTPDNVDDTTLFGAMFLAITHCLQNSNAVVCLLTDNTGKIWITPQGQTHPIDLRPWKKDGYGKTQNDYQDAMRKIAKYLGCYCIDAGSMASINYCHPEYLQDTIHQSEAGGKQYANAIWSVLKDIQPNVART